MLRVVSRVVQASLITMVGICIASCFVATRPFSRKKRGNIQSDHYDGKKFQNLSGKDRTLWDFFKWLSTRDALPWPKKVKTGKQAKPEIRVNPQELRVSFVNHSTVLIQWEGFNMITDPVWCERASPFSFAGPKRVIQPGIKLEDLPPLDLILLSHNHYDHMDIKTLTLLAKNHNPLIITGLGNGNILREHGITSIKELDWWAAYNVTPQFEVIYLPSEHFSSRGLFDRNEALWGGFAVKTPSGTLYFAGDTGYGTHFKEIRKRVGPIRLAMLPIGAYKPEWFMSLAHNSPADSVQAHLDLEANKSLAIHWDTFHLGEESYEDPPRVVKEEMEKRGLPPDDFIVMRAGEVRSI